MRRDSPRCPRGRVRRSNLQDSESNTDTVRYLQCASKQNRTGTDRAGAKAPTSAGPRVGADPLGPGDACGIAGGRDPRRPPGGKRPRAARSRRPRAVCAHTGKAAAHWRGCTQRAHGDPVAARATHGAGTGRAGRPADLRTGAEGGRTKKKRNRSKWVAQQPTRNPCGARGAAAAHPADR